MPDIPDMDQYERDEVVAHYVKIMKDPFKKSILEMHQFVTTLRKIYNRYLKWQFVISGIAYCVAFMCGILQFWTVMMVIIGIYVFAFIFVGRRLAQMNRAIYVVCHYINQKIRERE